MNARHILRTLGRAALVASLVAAAGCKRDNGLTPFTVNNVAVTAGDFDDVSEPLNRMVVAHSTYDGIISTATWDPELEHERLALEVETLLTDLDEITRHQAIFIASGTRGLGLREYNGLQADDHLVSDPAVSDNVVQYVSRPRALVVTDWGYDLVEAAFPDEIDFLGDDLVYDDAQHGEIGTVTADVVDELLVEELGIDKVAIRFNYSNWAVIEDVGEDVTVHLRGTVNHRATSDDPVQTLSDVPLLVSFSPPNDGDTDPGRVIFATFHIDAQNDAVIDGMIHYLVGNFEGPAGSSVNF